MDAVKLTGIASLSLRQVEAILDAAHNGIIAVDREGMVTIFNRAAEEITRRKKEEAVGRHLSQVVIPQGLLDILERGEGQLLHRFIVTYSTGNRTYLTNRSPILEKGRVVGAVGVFQDVSEMEAISEELESVKALNKELEALIESSYDGILVTDAGGVVLRVNKAHQRLTGIPTEEILGRSVRELAMRGLYLPAVINPVLRQGRAITSSEKTPAGNLLLITCSPVKNEAGEVMRVLVNVRDLTELNELKRQLEKTRELSQRYHSELKELRGHLDGKEEVVIEAPAMREAWLLALRVAAVDSTVLLLGESGVGKEVVARAVHQHSKRRLGPFIKVDCGAIPENLLESELFGYEAGAFTGASRDGKKGLFELAHNGTLLLDEIGNLPFSLQAKLLRAIQDREVQRVGGDKPRPVNVRLVASTNRDLEVMVAEGGFRDDLYFRLNVVPITIPPLRERREDIIPLAFAFKKKFGRAYGLEKEFLPEVLEAFLEYAWPGNVRELENAVERLMVTSPGPVVGRDYLPPELLEGGKEERPKVRVGGLLPLKEAVREVERQLLMEAMRRFGSTYGAARALGVDQSTVVRKLQRLRLNA